MAVQLSVNYEQVLHLVEQLSEPEQDEMIAIVLEQRAHKRPLTIEERLKLFDAAKLHTSVNETPSIRREDWYEHDAR